jgi:hypothetical protein
MSVEELNSLRADVLHEMQRLMRSWYGCVEMFRKSIESPKAGEMVRVCGKHYKAGSLVEFEKVIVNYELSHTEPTVMFLCKNLELKISEYFYPENIYWEKIKTEK